VFAAVTRSRAFVFGLTLAVAVMGLPFQPSQAAAVSPDIVISQLYGGGGATTGSPSYRNDYVELFNRGSVSVNVSGWSIQYASATGTTWSGKTNLTAGIIPPGRYFLVQESGGTLGAFLPAVDATGTIAMAAGAGKIAIVNNQTTLATTCPVGGSVIDLVGYGTANCFEDGAPTPALVNTTAAFRKLGGCIDTDSNVADFTVATPAPRNSASPSNICDVPTGIGSADPSTVAAGGTTLLTVTVTPASNPPSTGLAVTVDLTSIGGAVAQPLVNGGGNVFTYLTTVAGATTIGAKILPVTITDAELRKGSTSISLTVTDSCGDPKTSIHDIQGTGLTSPLVGTTRTIEGVVVGSYQGTGQFGGFYVQEPDAVADADPMTSEGTFVFSTLLNVTAGDSVRVNGTVVEFTTSSGGVTSSLTELGSVSFILVCGSDASVTPTTVTLPVPTMTYFERYEGMLVDFEQTLTVTETFNLGRFGELRLSVDGRLYTPTAVTTPGAAAIALEDENNRRAFVLDDGNNQQNIDPTINPAGGLSALDTLRSGYTVTGLAGVFDHRFGSYRLQPLAPVAFEPTNPRTDAPEDVGGNTRIASFNVLNFFNGDGLGGGFPTERGADTLAEFQRQLDKEVSALQAMNADIVGLMEIENDGGPNSAIADLVGGLNDAMGAGTYAYIDTGVIGTDAIKVALIYKPATITPIGDWEILTSAVDPRFIDTRNRPSLAQTFERNGTLEKLTVVMNHLKSKGSTCTGDPDLGDGQGNCNQTRTDAASALVDWLATDPTGSGDPDFVLIGDMNSYTFEDPITTFMAAGLTNLIREFGGLTAYSYVFNGEAGYLDHAIASPSLAVQVTGATDWHINADEPTVLDYNTEFKTLNQINTFYSPDPYRSSDHDPVVLGLELRTSPTALCAFTRQLVTSPGIARSLCAKLDAAAAADARGDANARAGQIQAYINEVNAQRGKAIANVNADTLITIASGL
jgi:predicted extracellular nuclease